MNKIVLMGRLTKDPEVRYTQGENSTAVASFSLAVNRKFKRENEPDADFFNCTAFGKQAEFVEKHLKKGTKIIIIGRVQNNNYTKQNGEKVYSVQVMVEEIVFAESKASSDNEQATPQTENSNGWMNVPTGFEEDLPFN